jgi:TRAP-type C4-dicarboxylate transport system permease small subunit
MTLSGAGRPALERLIERVSAHLATIGGLLLLALALLVCASVLRRWLTSRPLPGDFELVQMGLAVAVFAFLPYCELRGANIFVDSFTTKLPQRLQALLDTLWSLLYFAAAALIAWRMTVGAFEELRSGTTTMVLGLPTGWAMIGASALGVWLVVATACVAWRRARSAAR